MSNFVPSHNVQNSFKNFPIQLWINARFYLSVHNYLSRPANNKQSKNIPFFGKAN